MGPKDGPTANFPGKPLKDGSLFNLQTVFCEAVVDQLKTLIATCYAAWNHARAKTSLFSGGKKATHTSHSRNKDGAAVKNISFSSGLLTKLRDACLHHYR